jgi:hypothetical protein
MIPLGAKWRSYQYLALRSALMAVASIFWVSSAMRASDWMVSFNPPPLHPSVIMVDYKGKSYPVTAVAGEVPEIEVDGKKVRLHANQSYQPHLAAGYGRGFIRFNGQESSTVVRTMEYRMHGSGGESVIPGGTLSTSGEYNCKLFSTEAHTDCYIAVVFFRLDPQGQADARSIALAFGEVGDLAAGHETAVKIDCAYAVPAGGRYYLFPLIFSKGIEIRSDQSEIAAQFFHQQEMAAHAELLSRYRQEFPNADRPVVPYLRFPPLLPDGVDPHSLPPTIDAKFAVVESGEVDSLEITQVLDPRVEQAIRRALNGWLFLPRLKKGTPVRTMIDVPLSFGATSS